MIKKGINQWCFPVTMGVEKCMLLAKQAGFTGIELAMSEDRGSGADDPYELTLTASDDKIRAISDKARKIGLELPSIATGLLWAYPLTSSDEDKRQRGMSIIKKMIEAADIMNADTVLVVPGVVDETVSYKKAYERALDAFNHLKGIAEEHEIHIGIENVWNKFLLSPMEMLDFIDKINSPYVNAYFDVGNVLAYGYPEDWVEILGHHIKKVHIKDFNTSIGNIRGFTNLLQGDVKWNTVIKALKDIGYEDYLICELSPYKTFPEKLIYDASSSMDYIIGL